MNKDCNGCFGAAGDDCQKCQEVDQSRMLRRSWRYMQIIPKWIIAAR